MSSSLQLLSGYGSDDEEDEESSVPIQPDVPKQTPAPPSGPPGLSSGNSSNVKVNNNSSNKVPAAATSSVVLPSFDDAFSGRCIAPRDAPATGIRATVPAPTAAAGGYNPVAPKRPAEFSSSASISHKVTKHDAFASASTKAATSSSSSSSAAALAFKPPQLKRPNTVTEDIKLWTSEKKM